MFPFWMLPPAPQGGRLSGSALLPALVVVLLAIVLTIVVCNRVVG